jgi:predicted 2-oxoglutarate/Fe(II)-dependent dioxygenase YbiX
LKNSNISLTEYCSGSYLDLHTDSTSNYTTVIALTDDYSDGRFCLSTQNKLHNSDVKLDLKLGQGVTFDGSTLHGVLPVHSGVRYALNIWMNDTDFVYYKLDKTKKLI